eukprot:3894285-Pleurochrysis_carterae.AAC.1
MHRTDRVVRGTSSKLKLGVAQKHKNTWPNTPKRQKCITHRQTNAVVFDIACCIPHNCVNKKFYGCATLRPSTRLTFYLCIAPFIVILISYILTKCTAYNGLQGKLQAILGSVLPFTGSKCVRTTRVRLEGAYDDRCAWYS